MERISPKNDNGPAIKADNLRFAYGTQTGEALQGLSFSVGRGLITGILGPNGSGKSTTFKILSTQLVPSSGEAWVEGFSTTNQRAQVRRSLGVTFQSPSLDPLLTIKENLQIHAALYGLWGAAARTRIDELLKLFRLDDRAGDRVKSLSGGLARRVELAKTLLNRPGLLLLDEPTTGLDPLARLEFWQELRRLRDGGTSILVTTHLMDEADLCDELLFLTEGKLAAQGSPLKLKSEFGGDVILVEAGDVDTLPGLLQGSLAANDSVRVIDGKLRIESREPSKAFDAVRARLGDKIQSLNWGKPTLADIYFQKTGKKLS